ncbi:MAG: hypothetical protein GX039_07025 [Clostridia bacterium]|nr:hypothetical protein [Clostridia bacterium]
MNDALNRIGRQAVILVARLFLICLFSLAAAVIQAAAAPAEVEIKAEVGWEGQGVPGQMLPAVVNLHNPGAEDLEGVVEVVTYYKHTFPPPANSPPGTPPLRPPLYTPAAAYGEQMVLPAGSSKELTLWFPLRAPEKITFRFRDGEQVLASVEEKLPEPATSNLSLGAIGVLGQVPPALERVRLTSSDGVPRAPLILPLKTELLPQAAEHLEAFSTIVVTGFDGSTLTPSQRQALADWVKQGGQLILGGGAGIQQSLAILAPEMQEISVSGTYTCEDWQEAARWLELGSVAGQAATVAELQSSRATPLGDALSLGLEAKPGAGLLRVLAFDPLLEPWRSGNLGPALWLKLLQPPAEAEIQMKYGMARPGIPFNRAADLLSYTRYLPAATFPPARVAALYLLVFTFLAGPVIYLWLRRRQRPEYAWLAVPLLGMLFAAGVYVYMLGSGGNVLINAVRVVTQTGQERGNMLTAVGYYAPTAANFQARLADPEVPVQVSDIGGSWDLGEEDGPPPYTIVYGNDLTVDFNYLSQWGMRSLGFRLETGDNYQGLTAEVTVQDRALGGTLLGKIYNGTEFTLDHVALIAGTDFQVIPSLAPGEEVPVCLEITPPATSFDPRGYSSMSGIMDWQLFVPPAPANTSGGSGAAAPAAVSSAALSSKAVALPAWSEPLRPSRNLTVDERRRANLLNRFLNNDFWGLNNSVPLTLVAFSEAPMADLELEVTKGRKYYLTMWHLRPVLNIPAGTFTLPAGLIQPQLVDGDMRSSSGHGNAISIDDGYLIYAFRPLLPPEAKLQEITVNLPFFPAQQLAGGLARGVGPPAQQAAPVAAGALEIYNPTAGRWEELSGANSFRLPGSYAAPDGEVRLRINDSQATGGKPFYFLPPAVAYQGVRE